MKSAVISGLIALGVSFLALQFFTPADKAQSHINETAYDRVMQTGTLRCGYMVFPPYIVDQDATGNLTGIIYDYVEALAASLSLEVEWVEELGFGEFPTALETGRIDSFCSVAWISGDRARAVHFVDPIVYESVFLVGREGDLRFDNNAERANQADISFSALEGSVQSGFVRSHFPAARLIEIPQIASIPQTLVDVSMRKADLAIVSEPAFQDFVKFNPDQLRVVDIPPMRLSSIGISVKSGEHQLKTMLDDATQALIETGQIDGILRKYGYETSLHVAAGAHREAQ